MDIEQIKLIQSCGIKSFSPGNVMDWENPRLPAVWTLLNVADYLWAARKFDATADEVTALFNAKFPEIKETVDGLAKNAKAFRAVAETQEYRDLVAARTQIERTPKAYNRDARIASINARIKVLQDRFK